MTGIVLQRHKHLALLQTSPPNVVPDDGDPARVAVLVAKPLKDPLRGMPLLSRPPLIRARPSSGRHLGSRVTILRSERARRSGLHRSGGRPAVFTAAQLSAISAKPSTATPAPTSNPHSRPGSHHLPAGSFFGGFRTTAPCTGATAPCRAGIRNPSRKLPFVPSIGRPSCARTDLDHRRDCSRPSVVGYAQSRATCGSGFFLSRGCLLP